MNSAFRLPPSAVEVRLRWLLAAFIALSVTVLGRLVALEVREGDEYRAAGAEPIVRRQPIAANRGRILARDGTVLATDEAMVSLAVHYRWLEEPANSRWLRQMARSRLTSRERRDARRVAAEQAAVIAERKELAERLTRLCGLDSADWRQRTERIQRRVEAIADGVNARHGIAAMPEHWSDSSDEDNSLLESVGRSIVDALFSLDDPPPMAPITVIEQISEHVVFDRLPLEAVADIESNPQRFPGVKLVTAYHRTYPTGALAAQAVGFVGNSESGEGVPHEGSTTSWTGKSGVERQSERILGPRSGLVVERIDQRGRVKSSTQERMAVAGGDVTLTIDPRIQRGAEILLDESLRRRLPSGDEQIDRAAGGAVVVLDVHSGDVLAAATAPRFDPNAFVQGESSRIRNWLNDPATPMLDRTVQMALPPGSVFKVVTAAAILDAGINPRAPVDCLGYLHQPDALRCAIFRRTGVGHGPVTLPEALARSCNVYFFHHGEQLGGNILIDWARRFGLGERTGIELAGEAAGQFPNRAQLENSPAESRPMSIGQSTITTTPLQMARVAAAIGNGGRLVTPKIVEANEANPRATHEPPQLGAILGLNEDVLAAIRSGMRQAVADKQGTAHATVDLGEVAIAGKTGTAQAGGDRPDHAWFIGYAPADNPRVAFAIALEYAGDGAIAAGPIAKHLVAQMHDLGCFSAKPSARGVRVNNQRR
jgi:penicillin-binding protein 2